MADYETSALKLTLCAEMDSYVACACDALRAAPADFAIPLLVDDRSADGLEPLFPGRRLERTSKEIAADPAAPDCLIQRLLDAAPEIENGHGVLIAPRGSAFSIPAIFYASMVGRSVMLVDNFDRFDRLVLDGSTIFAGDPALFDKRLLRRILEWSQSSADGTRRFGLLTGRTLAQCTAVAAKMLAARNIPKEASTDSSDTGSGYELIGAHGNEIHLDYQDHTLCGRAPGARHADAAAFDCGIDCPHQNRLEANRIDSPCVLLISCDGFTPAGGIAPDEFRLLFRLLDGECFSILAPYKHIQANLALLTMIDGLAKSGYRLGDIAHIANGHANADHLPDYAYIVFGDPDTRPTAPGRPEQPAFKATPTSQGTHVEVECGPATYALSGRIPAPEHESSLALLPISSELLSPKILYALGSRSGSDTVDVTLFSEDPLPAGTHEFAILGAQRPPIAEIAAAGGIQRKLSLFREIFVPGAAGEQHAAAIRGLLDLAVSFPRPIESARNQRVMLNFQKLLRPELASLHRALRSDLFEELSRRRIWMSQDFGHLFQSISRAGPEIDGECPHCACHVTTWRYSDAFGNQPDRRLDICDRCGIVLDAPAASPIDIQFETIGRFERTEVEIAARIENKGDRPVSLSSILQVNEWRTVEVTGKECCSDFELDPGGSHTVSGTLTLPADFHDDVLSVHCFLITEQLDILCASQKVISVVRTDRAF